jgi:RNA polymerase sigma-70 factor (ECF subfamily)
LVFQYRYFDEKSYADIAAITGTSEGALKASYHFAKTKIEGLLKSGLLVE